MRRFGIGLLCAIVGYFAFAAASYFLIEQFSSNMHDRSMEAAMTSIFFFGPMGSVLAFIAGLIFGGRRSVTASQESSP
jgi:hypothetical protein